MNQKKAAKRDALVIAHLSMVEPIARHVAAKLPRSFELDDLIQAGRLGLLDAATKFDPRRGTPFAAYARIRIKGSILSSIRRHEWDNSTMQGLEEWHKEIADPASELDAMIETGKVRRRLEAALELLPAREEVVVSIKYFEEGADLNVAARRLQLCPSRASQLHRAGLQRLRSSSRLLRDAA